jgi:hypothetical protein
MFDDGGVSAPARSNDVPDVDDVVFDETDGAYAVAEPDPFAEPAGPRRASHHRPSLRAELRAGWRAAPRSVSDALAPDALALDALPPYAAPPVPGGPPAAPPPLPVPNDLRGLLPDGLRRGSTVAVIGSVSVLLALIGEASATGAWVALVGMPTLSAEAALEAGVDLSRLVIISPPEQSWTSASWTTAVGALLDAVDIVVARPGSTSGMTGSDGAARRLTARARNKDAVLMLYGQQAVAWPAVSVTLQARHDRWSGIGDGHGRITARRLVVSATGKGRSARPRSVELWLPRPVGEPARPAVPDSAAEQSPRPGPVSGSPATRPTTLPTTSPATRPTTLPTTLPAAG